ncbi:MAG: DEAD/DEAH box helicase [Proteobacteria bacterium]|nr:DEAD/DEAH box helicase [Desulfobacula sp.]MBU3951870.1 DEAD/DEAH box helicase [Pseudomonadota bacterium]MBU4132667.1 DEAD/DEAH box helicase [Pseudomonadota bacterium]
MSENTSPLIGFDEMNMSPLVLAAVQDAGYSTPTPIQALTIPHLIQGKDMIGQARTGTGKTAAFALPLLSRIDLENRRPQVLVLTPTRELAIQVAESFKTYGSKMNGLNVLSVYGGQSYEIQLKQLKRGVHVVVGTPGRLMDHMRRKTVSFADIFCVVLDEADEMLHMGFIEDVEWILDRTPDESQTALFSATMPKPIRDIAQKYLTTPKEIMIKTDTTGVDTINQKYWMVNGAKKAQALIRILEAATYDGVIVFVKTKTATLEVAKSLEDKGFKVEALNGDIAQNARERTISRLKSGHIDILVATDVAARGLDVERISHVINYDMPPKAEPYIHRIGRTGRAGRSGEAILFVNRNERWMLNVLERATKRPIEEILLPSDKDINKKRVADFKQAITQTLTSQDLGVFQELIEAYALEQDLPVANVAAALAKLAHGDTPFLLADRKEYKQPPLKTKTTRPERQVRPDREDFSRKKPLAAREKPLADKKPVFVKTAQPMVDAVPKKKKAVPVKKAALPREIPGMPLKKGMERYRIEVGHSHGVRAGDIVGAISNEAGLDSKYIKSVDINQDFSFVDLPSDMPKDIFKLLQNTWVRSQQMSISKHA